LTDEFGLEKESATRTYSEIKEIDADQWIAPWPRIMGKIGCSLNNETISCENGLKLNLKTKESSINIENQEIKPSKVSFINLDNEFEVINYTENILLDGNKKIGFAIYKEGEQYIGIMMDNALVDSIFVRLFYFEGLGLDHFEEFYKTVDITGQKIIVWKIKW
jgi:hypothetical protein